MRRSLAPWRTARTYWHIAAVRLLAHRLDVASSPKMPSLLLRPRSEVLLEALKDEAEELASGSFHALSIARFRGEQHRKTDHNQHDEARIEQHAFEQAHEQQRIKGAGQR